MAKGKSWVAGVILCAIILLSGALSYGLMSGGKATVAGSVTGSHFNYVLTIIMENQNNGSIFGNSCCPYETSLAHSYSLASAYYDIYSPSLPNYIALTSGSTQSITDDSGPTSHPLGATNIVDRLTGAGLTWKAYMESMPSPCYQSDSSSSGTYYVRHDPFVYYTDITGNSGSGTSSSLCQSNVVPAGGSCPNGASGSQILTCESAMLRDLNATSGWANYMWLTPNGCNDMHDCSTSTGDKYLSTLIPEILSSALFSNPANNAALFLLWDEYHPTPGAVWAGSAAKTAYRSGTSYNHYSAIRTIEDNWGLATISTGDGGASPMTEFFRAGATTPDFSLTASPSSLSFTSDATASSTMTMTPLNGFTGTVTLSVSSPSGITTACSQSSLTSTLLTSTCTFGATSAVSGTATLTGSSGTLTHSVSIAVTATPPATPDFVLGANPASVIFTTGRNGSSTISLSPMNGFTRTVSLTISSPSGITTNCLPGTLNNTAHTATCTFSSASAASGTVTVTGTSGTIIHSIAVSVTALVPGVGNLDPSQWSLTANSPSTAVISGGTLNETVIDTASSFSGSFYSTAQYLNENGWSGPPLNVSTFSAHVNIVRADTLSSGYLYHTYMGLYFTLPSAITAGGLTTSHIDGQVMVEQCSSNYSSGCEPAGYTYTSNLGNRFGYREILTTQRAGTGYDYVNYDVQAFCARAELAWGIPSTPCTPVRVEPGIEAYGVNSFSVVWTTFSVKGTTSTPDFTLSANPTTVTVVQGTAGTSTIILTSRNSFGATVTLSGAASLSSITVTFSPTSITLVSGGQATSALTISSNSVTPTGSYTVNVKGVAGALSHSATISFTVTSPLPPSDFAISASQSSLNIVQGSKGTSILTLTSLSGFAGTITLGSTISTSSASTSLSSGSVTVSSGGTGSSSLTISTIPSTPAGTYSVTTTATAGSLSHAVTVTVTVGASSALPVVLAVPSAETASQGSMLTFAVNASNPNVLGTISISVSNLPPGASFISTPGNPATGTFAWNPDSSVQPGFYTITFNAVQTGSSYSASRAVTIDVAAAPSNRCIFCSPSWLWPIVLLAVIGATVGLLITWTSVGFVLSHRGQTKRVPTVRMGSRMPAKVSVTPFYGNLRSPYGTRVSLERGVRRSYTRKVASKGEDLRHGRSTPRIRKVSRKRSGS